MKSKQLTYIGGSGVANAASAVPAEESGSSHVMLQSKYSHSSLRESRSVDHAARRSVDN